MSEQQFMEITGASASDATSYIDMASGDLQAALALFFGNPESSLDKLPGVLPLWWKTCFGDKQLPSAWTEQRLIFDCGFGISQGGNGPCGVLVALQGALLLRCKSRQNFSLKYVPSDDELADSIADLIVHCGPPFKVATSWRGEPGSSDVELIECKDEALLRSCVQSQLHALRSRAGLALIVASAFHSRGEERVKNDVFSSHGELPLTPDGFCSSELMSLMLRGVASGNVGSYSASGEKIDEFAESLGIGLLSSEEVTSGVLIQDSLKSPPSPIWILHTGDHFTLLFSLDGLQGVEAMSYAAPFVLFHWDGLPPAGPRMESLRVTAHAGCAPPAPTSPCTRHFRPIKGEIESVVQACPADKADRPDDFTTWRFEIMLATGMEEPNSDPRPADLPPPVTFDAGAPPSGAWRCRSCYSRRFETFCFGMNTPGTLQCNHCGKAILEAGWSIWLRYDQLPPETQDSVSRQFSRKILTVLRTKWTRCKVEFVD